MRRPPKGSHLASQKNSKYWRKQADTLWGKIIHTMYSECAMSHLGDCNGPLEAHHLITRSLGSTRHAIENGCLLCALHHKWSPKCSPHKGPMAFAAEFATHRPDQWEWLEAHRHSVGKYDYRQAVTELEDILKAVEEGLQPHWSNGRICFA